MNRNPAILALVFLGGCAADCGPDWRSTGERDGRINAGSQAASYTARCGGTLDAAAYEEGYRAGFARRPPPNW
jgi:hypothetical protein